jgi:hypothetical protein
MAVRINLNEFEVGWRQERRVGIREWLRVKTTYREIFYGSLIMLALTNVFNAVIVAMMIWR